MEEWAVQKNCRELSYLGPIPFKLLPHHGRIANKAAILTQVWKETCVLEALQPSENREKQSN